MASVIKIPRVTVPGSWFCHGVKPAPFGGTALSAVTAEPESPTSCATGVPRGWQRDIAPTWDVGLGSCGAQAHRMGQPDQDAAGGTAADTASCHGGGSSPALPYLSDSRRQISCQEKRFVSYFCPSGHPLAH